MEIDNIITDTEKKYYWGNKSKLSIYKELSSTVTSE
jgi:hypothetical protein